MRAGARAVLLACLLLVANCASTGGEVELTGPDDAVFVDAVLGEDSFVTFEGQSGLLVWHQRGA